MLTPAADAELRANGLVPYDKTLEGPLAELDTVGISCPWGPADSTDGGDAAALFVWARLTPESRAALLENIPSQYVTEETPRGTFVAITDGPGQAYELYSDDFYAFASSREQLDDIVWAR